MNKTLISEKYYSSEHVKISNLRKHASLLID